MIRTKDKYLWIKEVVFKVTATLVVDWLFREGRWGSELLGTFLFGEGNGTPLQYSCLENPMEGKSLEKSSSQEEPGGLQSMGLLRVGHDWATSLSLFPFMHWRRKWQPTPVFLPGESQGAGSWWAAIYGVAQSWTRLKWLSSSRERVSGKGGDSLGGKWSQKTRPTRVS